MRVRVAYIIKYFSNKLIYVDRLKNLDMDMDIYTDTDTDMDVDVAKDIGKILNCTPSKVYDPFNNDSEIMI